ncbi:alpha/beta fold hydrolase [Chloroflexota bacterium]
MRINANGISMNYEVQGNGPWLTLIHGSGNSLDVWAQQVEALSMHFSMLTYDIRGHGGSDLGTDPVTADILTEDLHRLFVLLGITSSTVLGHSMGAEIAIRLYLKHSHMVDNLILCNSTMGALLSEQESLQSRMNQDYERNDNPDLDEEFDSRITRYFSSGLAQRKPEVIERYNELLNSNRNEKSQQERMYQGEMIGELIHAPVGKFRQVSCPTLIILGLNDAIVRPSAVEPVMKYFNNMHVEIIPTGHFSNLELPDEFSRIALDFVSSKGI